MNKDTLLKVIAWERAYRRYPDPQTIVDLFQEFIDTGEIRDLDDYYKEAAKNLIECGLCHRAELKVIK